MSPTFLIVDDNRLSRLILQGFFEYLCPDWQVFHAENGEEALSIASTTRLDLVCTDSAQRGVNGIETARALLKIQPDVRVAVLTSHLQAFQSRPHPAGIRFVAKPVTLASVREVASLMEEIHGTTV